MATIAVFFALGGTSYAIVVTGAMIADDTITAADIAPNAVRDSELAEPSVGSAQVFDNSLTYEDIRESDLGIGTKIVHAFSSSTQGSVRQATATCSGFGRVIGTGGQIDDAGLNVPVALKSVTPTNFDAQGRPRSVTAVGRLTAPSGQQWQVRATAICVDFPVD